MKHQVTEAIMDLVFWRMVNSGKTYREAAQCLIDYFTDNPTFTPSPDVSNSYHDVQVISRHNSRS